MPRSLLLPKTSGTVKAGAPTLVGYRIVAGLVTTLSGFFIF
jgi:hypothetical protein